MPDRLSRKTTPHLQFRRFMSLAVAMGLLGAGCSTSPQPKFKRFAYPKNAFTGDVQRPYTVLGPVRARVDYPSLDFTHEEKELCRNYFNKAVRDLVRFGRQQGADAVLDVKSVTFLIDGRTELHAEPECSDDGAEGQILAQGIAVKWKGGNVEAGAWASPLARQKAQEATAAKIVEDAKSAKEAKAAEAVVKWPAATRSGMPMMPEGGTFVGDSDLDEPTAEEAAAEKITPAAEKAAPEAPAPTEMPTVTGKFESYDPQKALLSVPEAPTRIPAAESAVTHAEAIPAAPRFKPGDPRAVPGLLRRALP
jgi:hypothetical protein